MYWAAAQLQPQRDTLALHFLQQNGFETYAPRLREPRTAGMKPRQRIEVLLSLLGSSQRVMLAADAVEAVSRF